MGIPKGARILPNGDFFLLKRKHRNPQPVEGFVQKKDDPWYYRNLFKPCEQRNVDREETGPCGKCVKRYYRCALHDKEVNFIVCSQCEDRTSADVDLE